MSLNYRQAVNSFSSFLKKISSIGLSHADPEIPAKKIILTNQLAFIALLFSFFNLVTYLRYWLYLPLVLECAAIIIYALALLLNYYGYNNSARILGISNAGISTFLMAEVLGPEAGIHLYFYAIAAATFILFELKDRWKMTGCLLLNFILFMLSEYADFALFRVEVPAELIQSIHASMIPASIIAVIVCIAVLIIENHRYEEQIDKAREIAEEAEKTQEQFLANMSHEIRTPMNGIMGMTHILLDTPLTEQQKKHLQAIKSSSDQLLLIINEILDFAKIKSGKINFDATDVDLNDLIESTLLNFRHIAERKNIILKCDIDPSVPPVIITDPVRLRQVLTNLVSNALKFTEKGAIAIEVTRVKKENEPVLEFTVKDTGIGIPPGKIHLIFESFTQASSDTTRKYGGTGLGLAICRQLIEQQGGKIWADSKPGLGSTFTFHLPVKISEKTSLEKKPVVVFTGQRNLAGKNILITEDNPVNQQVLTLTLTNWGANTDIAEHGKMCIEKLKQKGYDLILMDIQMPEMDGMEASRIIRKELKSNVPIIAITASILRQEFDKCLEAGMNDYISKPFEPDELFLKIAMLLKLDAMDIPVGQPKTFSSSGSALNLNFLRSIGNEEFVRKVLGMFVKQSEEFTREANNRVNSGNFSSLTTLIHKYKSSVQTVGNKPLWELLSVLEILCRDKKDVEAIKDLVEKALRSVADSTAECRHFLEEKK